MALNSQPTAVQVQTANQAPGQPAHGQGHVPNTFCLKAEFNQALCVRASGTEQFVFFCSSELL